MKSSWLKSLLGITPLSVVLTLSGCGSSPISSIPSPPPSIVVGSTARVLVTPGTATILRGQSQKFVAQVSGLSDQSVNWHATTNAGTIDSTGLYTAPSDGASAGYFVTITAVSKVAPGVIGTALVTLPSGVLTIAPAPLWSVQA